MENVPMTAWEQAVIVVLFCVLVLAIIAGLYTFVKSILAQFEKFVSTLDKRWQDYFDQREKQFGERNNAVVETIKALTKEVISLRENFNSHDDSFQKAIAIMEERTRSRTKG